MASPRDEVSRLLGRLRAELEGPAGPAVRAWKASGRPVVGSFCSYVPVELVAAAGALPLRLRGAGSADSSSADVYLSARTCSYVRHAVALALDGELAFLDGEVSANGCDHVRRAYDTFRLKTGIGFHGFLSVPRNVREELFGYYLDEVRRLGLGLERHLGVAISPEALRAAAAEQDRLRGALGRADRLRAAPAPLLSGSDLLAASVASTAMPAGEAAPLVEALAEAAEAAGPGERRPRARLLLAGGELDDPAFVAAIERQGAAVVADALCTGTRSFGAQVGPIAGDPLEAVARRTFFGTPCARMIGNFPDRVAALLELVRDREVDGVVLQRLKFCDPWGAEAHNLRVRLGERGLPLLVLEREYGLVHAGQVSTRVQAFVEMIEAGRAGGGP